MLGTELLAGLGAANPRVDGISKAVSKRLGYKGNKRYTRLRIKGTATAAALISVTALLHSPAIGKTSYP